VTNITPEKALKMLRDTGGGLCDVTGESDDSLLSSFEPVSVYSFSSQIPPDNVFFWLEQPEKYGSRPPHLQGTQDCVSHSFGFGLEDWYLNQCQFWPGKVATEVLYGGSRVLIGEKKLAIKGTYCSWVANFILRYGYLPRGSYVGEDLVEYNPMKADRYGRDGLPNVIPGLMTKVLNPDTTKPVRLGKLPTAEAAWSAVGQKCPVPFATKRGFDSTRGYFGICKPQGEWKHSMLVRGRCIVASGAMCFAVQNSIGNYLGEENREVTLLSGRKVLLPAGVFLVEFDVFDDICKTEDSYVLF
jgi:hypothetical protein